MKDAKRLRPKSQEPGQPIPDDYKPETIKENIVLNACEVCGCPPETPGVFRLDVPPGHPKFGKLNPCPKCYAPKMARQKRLRGQLDGSLKSKTFDSFGITDANRTGYNASRNFSDNPIGWLTLCGGFGWGKTHLAAAIANEHGESAKYFNFPDLVSAIREDFSKTNELIRRVITIPLLVLDEVEKAHIPEGWTREQVQRIFDSRYRTGEAEETGLVIAFNHSPEALPDTLQFLCSRIRDEQFVCIELHGDNRPIKNTLIELAEAQNNG